MQDKLHTDQRPPRDEEAVVARGFFLQFHPQGSLQNSFRWSAVHKRRVQLVADCTWLVLRGGKVLAPQSHPLEGVIQWRVLGGRGSISLPRGRNLV